MGTSNAFGLSVLSVLMLLSVGPAQAASTYIVAGALIDPLNATVIKQPVVEVQDDRIVAVTSGGKVPDNAEVIDLGSATILPGLADLHVHLTLISVCQRWVRFSLRPLLPLNHWALSVKRAQSHRVTSLTS